MRIAVSMWSFDRRVLSSDFGQIDFVRWAKAAGLTHVELLSYYMRQENNLETVNRELNENGLEVSCYTILSDFTTPSQSGMDEFTRDLEAASALGSPFVRVLAGEQNSDATNAIEVVTEGLKKAAREAAARNIVLVLENVGTVCGRTRDLVRCIDAVNSPSLRVNFDTANPLLVGEEPQAALADLYPHVAYIHVKDFVSEHQSGFSALRAQDPSRVQISLDGTEYTGIPAGRGEAALDLVLEVLKIKGYDGFVSVEYEGTGDAQRDTEESLSYLRSKLR